MIKKGHPFNVAQHHPRFHFYDSVLLHILNKRSLRGADIFTDLFKKNKADEVFAFLDNETTLADELKIIVHNKNDFEWAEKNAIFVRDECKLFLQPEWSKAKEMMPLIVDYVMQHPRWNISLQTHKYMNIP